MGERRPRGTWARGIEDEERWAGKKLTDGAHGLSLL